jgi:hypothetical protein
VLEEGFKFCLDTRNNRAFPLDPACPEHLNVRSLAGLPYGVFIFLVCTQEKEKEKKKKRKKRDGKSYTTCEKPTASKPAKRDTCQVRAISGH